MARRVYRIHKISRRVEGEYASAAEAARALDLRPGLVDGTCRLRSLPHGDFYFRYADDFDPDESFAGKRFCPLVLTDVDTGRSRWFGDAVTCSEALSWSKARLYVCIREGRGSLLGGQYLVQYASTRPASITQPSTR